MSSTFMVRNFGCRASQADGAAIESDLRAAGFVASPKSVQPELVVLNTCTVTAAADDELRRVVRKTHRENPAARIVITGCYAQRAPDDLAALPGVSLVVGNSHKTQLVSLLAAPYHGQIAAEAFSRDALFPPSRFSGALTDRARPNLKIQDGCSNRCSFCIIPSVRGRSRSSPLQDVVEQVQQLSKEYPEVILTGINLGRWGREQDGKLRLVDLLRALLSETDIGRIRLSSVEPMDWSDELLHLVTFSARIAKHVHAPLQSASDAILRRMHRKYRQRHYADRILKAHELMPDAAIGADVMTGFPGETAGEFDETRKFVESMPFTYLHVFPYSERPGTPAAALPQVPVSLREERSKVLQQISAEKNREFRRTFVGRRLSAVTLLDGSAMTTNYVSVELTAAYVPRRMIEVPIGSVTSKGVREASLLPVLPGGR